MKSFAKKSLALLLAAVIAATVSVAAFAVTENSEEIFMFNMDIDYETNTVSSIYFGVDGFSVLNSEDFAFSIFDSQENEVFNETMCDVEAITPEFLDSAKGAAVKKALAEDPVEEPMEYMAVWLTVIDEFIVSPDDIYTIVIAPGSFSTADEQQKSPELKYAFLPSDYIYVPTIWDKILWFFYSKPVLGFIFAPLIRFIELFYYNPLGPWSLYPIY